ncbi:hypothetical protein J4447_02560 [Candidatus Pacearchaeota archaeon]|nr:hypothetical protein [Candidatus Pacearchaeota archaeon]
MILIKKDGRDLYGRSNNFSEIEGYNKNSFFNIPPFVFFMYQLKNSHELLQICYEKRINLNRSKMVVKNAE